MSKRKNMEGAAMLLIYLRYLLPVLLCIMLIGLMLVPNLRYSTSSGTQEQMSVAQLLSNSWNQVRENLFGSTEVNVLEERFSWTLIILIPILYLLFAVGLLSSIVVAVGGLLYINSPDFRRSEGRIWFVTLLPNRVVVCILQALVLPLLFYSRIIIPIYKKILRIDVLLNVDFPEVWIFGLVFFALTVALCIWSAKYEMALDCDPFKRIASPKVRVVDPDGEEDDGEAAEPSFKTEAEREYYERQRRAREEQAELIRKLLNKDKEENEDE